MKVMPFLSSIAPSFKRDDVTTQLDSLRQSLVEETIPVFETAANDFSNGQFRSRAFQDYERDFKRAVDTPYRGNNLEVTLACLRNLQAVLAVLDNSVATNFSRDIVTIGLSYRKATLLQLVAQMSFAVDYARQNLLYLMACEANVHAKTLSPGKERPTPEIKWLDEHRLGFFKLLGIMSYKTSEMTKAIEAVPEISVSPDNADVAPEVLGPAATDPLKMNFIPLGINPFYAIGMRYANWQVARNNRAKAEKRALEMRLEQLRMQRRGAEDATLENKISFYEEEVNKLAAAIAKFEA